MGKNLLNLSLEEKLKYFLVPPRLYMAYRSAKEYKKGEKEIRILNTLVGNKKNSIDIGANKGVYTYFLAKLSKKVYAFEPNPKVFAFLKKSLPGKAEAFFVALSNKDGKDILRIPRSKRGVSNQGGSLSHQKVPDNYVAIEIDSKTLDSYSLKNIGFIKIDVEGFEREVLEGAKQTVCREKPNILIEMEERHTKRPIEEDIKWVENLGYKGFFYTEGEGLKSIDFFDGNKHHRQAYTKDRDNYVFNFIFLPMIS